MRYFVYCLISICFCSHINAQSSLEVSDPVASKLKKLNEAQLQADFEIVQHALIEVYGSIYRLADSITVQKRFDRYRKQLTSVYDQAGFISLLTTLIASFRDGHMKLEYDDDTKHLSNSARLFPFTVVLENEKLIVLYNETGNDQTILPGMEILNINGYSAIQLIKSMMPHISADGYGNTHRKKRLADNFPQNLWLYFGQQEQFIIKAKDSTGKRVIVKVAGVADAQRQANRNGVINVQSREGVRKLERWGPNILLSFTNEGKTGDLRIQGFNGENFTNELDSVFRLINQQKPTSLILDLRGNGGGADVYGAALVSHLTSTPFRYFSKVHMRTINPSFGGWSDGLLNTLRGGTVTDPAGQYHLTGAIKNGIDTQQPSAVVFKGRLFVLTDGYTFSTAADAAAVIRQVTTAVFIGEETGGGAEGNTSGIFARIKLPNSGLSVNIPALCYWNAVTVRKKNRGVLPDYPLINTVSDLLNSNDRQWKFAVGLAGKAN